MGDPGATWAEVAEAAGCHRNTLERWRDTESWEIAVRQAGTAYVANLAPAANAGLRKAWDRGNPAGALDVLKALGFLPPVTANSARREDRDLDTEIEELLRRHDAELRDDGETRR